MADIILRPAVASDCTEILLLIKELAAYEKLSDDVHATVQGLEQHLFGDDPKAFAVMAQSDGQIAGFALCFYNFSTFLTRPGIYLEDLYVRPAFRGQNIGQKLMKYLARRAVDEGCGRFEWWVLDWNEPAIGFYKKLGAKPMDEWTVFRVDGENLLKLAKD